jgi:hypothetical protein
MVSGSQIRIPEPPTDRAYGFSYAEDLYLHPEGKRSIALSGVLTGGRPPTTSFWYRQSPRYLDTLNADGVVSPYDPPPIFPGMLGLTLDPQGRLLEFRAVPLQQDDSGSVPATDWSPLFAAARSGPRLDSWPFGGCGTRGEYSIPSWKLSWRICRSPVISLRGTPGALGLALVILVGMALWSFPSLLRGGLCSEKISWEIKVSLADRMGCSFLLKRKKLGKKNLQQKIEELRAGHYSKAIGGQFSSLALKRRGPVLGLGRHPLPSRRPSRSSPKRHD